MSPQNSNGWKWEKLSDISEKITDGEHLKPKSVDIGVPFLSAKDVRDGEIDFSSPQYISVEDAQRFLIRCNPEKNDILIVSRGATIGRSCIVNVDYPFCLLGSVILLKIKPGYNPKFIYYALKCGFVQKELFNSSGSTAQPAIYLRDIKPLKIPICSLDEQNRIVIKIEQLLARVEAANEKLNRVPAIMQQFRQSVLAAACSGRLTENWHREYSDISWKKLTIEDVCKVNVGGTPYRKQSTYWDGDIPWISSSEVANNQIYSSRERITEEGLKNSSAKVYPKGTVLIAMIGEGKTRGQSSILQIDASTNQNVAGLIPQNELVTSKYLWFWALSHYERNRNIGRGGGQPALNKKLISELNIDLPPLMEQKEIVRRVESLFTISDRIKPRIMLGKELVDTITQSILHQAFTGQLS